MEREFRPWDNRSFVGTAMNVIVAVLLIGGTIGAFSGPGASGPSAEPVAPELGAPVRPPADLCVAECDVDDDGDDEDDDKGDDDGDEDRRSRGHGRGRDR